MCMHEFPHECRWWLLLLLALPVIRCCSTATASQAVHAGIQLSKHRAFTFFLKSSQDTRKCELTTSVYRYRHVSAISRSNLLVMICSNVWTMKRDIYQLIVGIPARLNSSILSYEIFNSGINEDLDSRPHDGLCHHPSLRTDNILELKIRCLS